MEEDKKTVFINKEDVSDGENRESAGGVTTDTIEYTLLVHEVPELMQAAREAESSEESTGPSEAEEAADGSEADGTDGPEAAETASEESENAADDAESDEEAAEDAETSETEAAGEAAEEEAPESPEQAGGVPDETIEYTLLAHEVPDLIKEGYTPKQEPEVKDDERRTRYGLPADRPETKELAHRMEERRRYKERKRRLFRTRFYVGVSCFIVLIAAAIISVSGIFTVDSIEVKGNSHYSAEEIINMGHAVPGRNLIYHANKEEIQGYLEQNPYIKSAVVSRKLPSTLVISVTERTERLAFRYDDDYLIMDEDGIVLKKTRNQPMVTLVEGLVVSQIKLGEKIGTEDNRKLNRTLDLIKEMIKADLYFVKLDVENEKRIRAYIYDTLVVKNDYDTLMTSMENGRLHLVLENIFSDGIERGTITFEEDGTASFQPAI